MESPRGQSIYTPQKKANRTPRSRKIDYLFVRGRSGRGAIGFLAARWGTAHQTQGSGQLPSSHSARAATAVGPHGVSSENKQFALRGWRSVSVIVIVPFLLGVAVLFIRSRAVPILVRSLSRALPNHRCRRPRSFQQHRRRRQRRHPQHPRRRFHCCRSSRRLRSLRPRIF